MIHAKQISSLSTSARSFFLGGTRSSAADGNSCTSAEDGSCVLRCHQTRPEAVHTGNRVFTRSSPLPLHVPPPVLPVKPDPTKHKNPLADGPEVCLVDPTLPITSAKAIGSEHLGKVYTTSASKDSSEKASPGTKQASSDVPTTSFHNSGFKMDAYQANQVLKQMDNYANALGFFYWLKRQPGFKHDGHTYTTMVVNLGRAKQFGEINKLLNEMVRDGCQPNTVTYNRLIHSYGRSNYLKEAMDVFRQMQEAGCERDRVTYCTLIDIHAKAGFLGVRSFECS